jgi:CubicO group peptidase (beta-lactamase class C family)
MQSHDAATGIRLTAGWRRRDALAGSLATLLPGSAALAAGPGSEAELLRDRLRDAVRRGYSGAVLVARGDQVMLHEGFGAIRGHAIERDDRFWISSTAKQFIAAAVLQLSDQGLLSLDDPLSRFFPAIPADKLPIKMRQLLSHTSGLPQGYQSEGMPDMHTALAAITVVPLSAAPGTGFQYSNLNYDLAATVIEQVSGLACRDYVRARLWGTVGLARTAFASPSTTPLVSPLPGEIPPRLQSASWGAHGAYSTVADLFLWFGALRKGQVISVAARNRLWAPVVQIGEGMAALGWFHGASAGGIPCIFTRGNDDFGPNSLIYWYPRKGLTIIVLTHAGDESDERSWSRAILDDAEAVLRL